MRATSWKHVLVAAALLGAVACQHRGSTDETSDGVGALGLALKLSTGQHIDAVHYKLSGGALSAPIEADLNVAGEATSFDFQISSVPAGTGYRVDLSAKTNEPISQSSCTGSQGNITVTAGAVVDVPVVLICRGTHIGGNISVNGSIRDFCPTIDTWLADRTDVAVGDTIDLTSTGHDPDATDALTFTWSSDAAAGTFTPPTGVGRNVGFTCTSAGSHVLALTLSDGQPACDDRTVIDVNCTSPTCGNGVVDAHEACDPTAPGAQASTCRSNCTVAACGDGIVDASLGETCDDGAKNGTPGDRCRQNCTFQGECGDGIVDPPEQCDPPNGVTCDATCTIIAIDACNLCDANNPVKECGPLFTSVRADPLGRALLACIHATRCDQLPSTAGTPDLAVCYCGPNYDVAACIGAGQPPGPCTDAYLAAAGITHRGADVTSADNHAVADNFLDPSFIFGKTDELVQKCEEVQTRCGPSCTVKFP